MQRNPPDALKFKTFLINLPSSQQRLEMMSEQLRNAGIEFERVVAVDGRQKVAKRFKEYDEALALRRYGRPMSGPEVGCFLSHRHCAEEFLRSGQRFLLVLEDDVYLPPGLPDSLDRLLNCLQQQFADHWHVVNLGNPPHKYFRPIATIERPSNIGCLTQSFYFPLGTFALLWSRAGAEEFLERSSSLYAPVDQFLRDWCATTGRGFAISPSLIAVDRSHSYIRPRLSDRLRMNLLRYWMVKNIRLVNNHRRAIQMLRKCVPQACQQQDLSWQGSSKRCA